MCHVPCRAGNQSFSAGRISHDGADFKHGSHWKDTLKLSKKALPSTINVILELRVGRRVGGESGTRPEDPVPGSRFPVPWEGRFLFKELCLTLSLAGLGENSTQGIFHGAGHLPARERK